MPSHRSLRMAEAIREVVASAILFEMADPRIRAITVLGVELTGDLRNATVAVSIMGTEAEQDAAFKALRHGAGFLQSRVAARLQTRFTPSLTFKRDDSVKKSIAMSRLIDDVIAADREAAGEEGPEPEPDPESEPESETGTEPEPDADPPAEGPH